MGFITSKLKPGATSRCLLANHSLYLARASSFSLSITLFFMPSSSDRHRRKTLGCVNNLGGKREFGKADNNFS